MRFPYRDIVCHKVNSTRNGLPVNAVFTRFARSKPSFYATCPLLHECVNLSNTRVDRRLASYYYYGRACIKCTCGNCHRPTISSDIYVYMYIYIYFFF